jgi:hypothetical protein
MNTLKAMERAGHIKLANQTGVKVSWYGHTSNAYYIDGPAEDKPRHFTYKNNDYEIDYVSGCFYPFVFKVN